jgi:OOP family OmpA-OmpF porin
LLLLCSHIILAQNLIPDSSFEYNKLVPTDFSSLNFSGSWRTASWGTSDLFCECDRNQKKYSMVDVPQNPMGYQEAHSGSCYGGIFAFSHGDYREYIQTSLQTPLQKDKYYRFTMYVSLGDYSRTSVDRLGVCFLTSKAGYDNSDVITNLSPVYMAVEKEVSREKDKWHRLSVIYKSKGGETWLLIGSFEIRTLRSLRPDVPKGLKTHINQKAGRDAYYYIDDVSLFETDYTEPPESKSNPPQLSNNQQKKDTVVALTSVLFESSQSIILPSSFSHLDTLFIYLKKDSQNSIVVNGHTDNSGTEKMNEQLSIRRAKAVYSYLIAKGINKTKISYRGYGSSKPIASNETEEGKQQNRRVEFVVTKK